MKKTLLQPKGFTLIETAIYLGLFVLIIGGAVLTAYQIFESSGRTQTHAAIQEEGDFLVAKINWVLSGVKTVDAPGTPLPGDLCATSNTLSVTKWDTTVGVIVMNLLTENLMMSRSGNPPAILNNTNTTVSALAFSHCTAGGTNPEHIEARFTLSGKTQNGAMVSQEFFTSDYLRK